MFCSAVYNLKPILRIIKTITSHTTNIFDLDVSVQTETSRSKMLVVVGQRPSEDAFSVLLPVLATIEMRMFCVNL